VEHYCGYGRGCFGSGPTPALPEGEVEHYCGYGRGCFGSGPTPALPEGEGERRYHISFLMQIAACDFRIH
jgi:hypothetical protein